MNKAELRKALLQKRQAIAPEEWQQKSLQLCHHLQNSSWFRSAQTILAYFSVRQEPDLGSLFAHPKTWGISRCVGKELYWHHWLPDGIFPLQIGPYGILEPDPEAPQIAPEAVDLLLVPAIACDHQGYRLGYGGGFFDRLLSTPSWSTKVAIGIVFESARLPKLPRDSWDCPLTAVCTEAGLFFENKLVS